MISDTCFKKETRTILVILLERIHNWARNYGHTAAVVGNDKYTELYSYIIRLSQCRTCW